MCGICGFTGKLPDSKEVLTRMMDRIKHRGPDSAGSLSRIRLPGDFGV